MITSLQNPRIKLVQALQTQAKTRRKEGKVALEGARLVRDAVAGGHTPDFVLHTPGKRESWLENRRFDLVEVSDEVMRKISNTEQPQGIIGVFPLPAAEPPVTPQRILILDAIRDPGNLGTILRTAAAAGAQAVVLAPGCVDPYNPKVLRAGMGAHFRLPVLEMSWSQIEHYTAPLRVYLADSRGDIRYDAVDWPPGWGLVIGSEAHGASTEAARMAHARVMIPMAAETESINAAMAAGIILFEARRQEQSR